MIATLAGATFEWNFHSIIGLIPLYAPLIVLVLAFINIWARSSSLSIYIFIIVFILFGTYFIDLWSQYDWNIQNLLNAVWQFFQQHK